MNPSEKRPISEEVLEKKISTGIETALLHFKKRFNCAQSLLAAYAVDLGMDREMALRIGNAFGGGLGKTGDTCGAVTGALIIIGLKNGAIDVEDNASKDITYMLSKIFIETFRASHHSILCRELMGFDISTTTNPNACERAFSHCPQYIQTAAEILEGLVLDKMSSEQDSRLNSFDRKLAATKDYPLKATDISTFQINIGYKCNLRCTHCHVEASPNRDEEMKAATVEKIIAILKAHDEIKMVDITGGAPELNLHYRHLIASASALGKKVITRTNLAILIEQGMDDIPAFWVKHKVKVVASLPSFTEEVVDRQRGKGVFKKAIAGLKLLNALGYGQAGTGLELDIMFNPEKENLAPGQQMLEQEFRDKLREICGITFNHLIALNNMPIGRLGSSMSGSEKEAYLNKLEKNYNPLTLKNLMCRHLLNVSPDGTLYDCDFWQMMNLPVNCRSSRIEDFDLAELINREIVTLPLCFMCTAGAGASCSGALAEKD